MRLDSILIVFLIHISLSVYVLSTTPVTNLEGGLRDILFFPVRQIINIFEIGLFGIYRYIPYILNSLLWSIVIMAIVGFIRQKNRKKYS
jgi:energy-coupling factor transporter transmembrane protein EcfT